MAKPNSRPIAKALGTLFVLFAVLVSAFLAINAFDEELHVELKDVLSGPVKTPSNAVQAYKYFLGIRVAPSEDPLIQGEAVYKYLLAQSNQNPGQTPDRDRSKDNVLGVKKSTASYCHPEQYCSREVYSKNKTAIEDDLAANALLIQRFDRLMSYGEIGAEFQPKLENAVTMAILIELLRVKQLQLNARLYSGRAAEAAKDMVAIQKFFIRSLERPTSMIDVMIAALILKSNRRFIESASKDHPDLKDIISGTDLEAFNWKPSYEDISKKVILAEAHGVYNTLSTLPPDPVALFNLSKIDDNQSAESPFWTSKRTAIGQFLFKRNKTINLIYKANLENASASCVHTNVACPESRSANEIWMIENPIGRYLASMLTIKDRSFKKLKDSLNELEAELQL